MWRAGDAAASSTVSLVGIHFGRPAMNSLLRIQLALFGCASWPEVVCSIDFESAQKKSQI
jgi:hypothetical protein